MPVARARRRGRGVRLCEELVSPALSESPHIERLADAQHSARRDSQQLVLPATPHPLLVREQTRCGTARARGGPCGQRGRRSPAESHGEAGCGSARLKRRGRANRIGIAVALLRARQRSALDRRRHGTPPFTEENQPESVSPHKSMSIVAEQPPRWSRPGQHFPKI